ncbi:MAG: PDZ domain-containing protein [Candidatus Abyssobacteria bacterium SURF_5]|uniref:PDZ domain-containing protein n=1 Tax=Abyssobacteria bacterium (strain SURF_5) TaxID=2093360 RepID=A0A3A4NXI8_ABYX5|nr:MAG: PDZ domain-containing protein [Candidatus Abyssubacteria bacterium SURF_5]
MPIRIQHLRTIFWAVDLTLTAVVVFFLVRGAQFLFAAPISEPAPLALPQSNQPEMEFSKIKSYEQYAALRKSNLFGALSSSNVSVKKVVEERLPETTLELELLGCVAAATPQSSFAIIRDKKGRVENTYGVGDSIMNDARLEEVRENEVVIARAGRREVLAMSFSDKEGGRPGPNLFGASRPQFPSGLESASSDVPIRVVNENLRYVNRAKMLETIGSNIGQLAGQVHTSPNVVDNQPAGMKIDQVGSDPLLGQSGLQPGDIVKSVNGIRVNSVDDLMGQSERLQSAPEIRVVVERDGRHRTLVYKIR